MKEIIFRIRQILQKIFRGYSDYEVFELHFCAAKWLLPRLKALRRMNHHYKKTPGLEGMEWREWNGILKKIIWSMEFIANGEDTDRYVYTFRDCHERCKEGCRLLGEWFRALWD